MFAATFTLPSRRTGNDLAVRRIADRHRRRRLPGTLAVLVLCTTLLPRNGHPATGDSAAICIAAGLANVRALDTAILVDLKYSSADNFLGKDLYGDQCDCCLQPAAAEKLAAAQQRLSNLRPGFRLLVYDCARPRSVQKAMFDLVKNTPRQRYVAHPSKGSMHNYGCAVDLTIAGADGVPIDMGTPFDSFDSLAQPRYEERFLREGRLTRQQVGNRRLLRTVMKEAGFAGELLEWWHFNAFPKQHVRETYRAIE